MKYPLNAPHETADERNALRALAKRVLVTMGVVGLGLGGVLLLWFGVRVLLLAFAGALLAVFLYTIASWLARWTHMPYWVALAIACVLLLGLAAGCVWLVEARVSHQMDSLRQQLPAGWERVRGWLAERGWGRWVLEQVRGGLGTVQHREAIQSGMSFLSAVGTIVGETFVVVFVGLFGAITPQLYVRGLMRLVPPSYRPRGREVVQETGNLMWWWLVGQLVSMAFIGVATFLAVWLIGVPLALTLALIAALLNFIPNFGPLVAAIPAALLALLQGPMAVLWILIAYTVIQLLQNHVVTPVVQQTAVDLPAAVLILTQVLMYYWAGLLGMALAPPLAAIAIRIVQILYVRDALGDPIKRGEGFWPESV